MFKHLRSIGSVITASWLLVACDDGGSGVSSSKRVLDLDSDEARAVCEYILELEGPPRVVECPDGDTVQVGTDPVSLGECVMELEDVATDCQLTVGQFEACFQALSDDPCAGVPAVCAPVLHPTCFYP